MPKLRLAALGWVAKIRTRVVRDTPRRRCRACQEEREVVFEDDPREAFASTHRVTSVSRTRGWHPQYLFPHPDPPWLPKGAGC